jgi:prepilin-type N-terminal cleavage/methylation domain-containing protein
MIYSRGFTLIEMLVVLAIAGLIASAGLPVSWELYRQNAFQDEFQLFVHIIGLARSESLNNENGAAHGVFISDDAYTLFAGDSYDPHNPTNERFPRNTAIAASGGSTVIFAPITADSESQETFTFTSYAESQTLSVGPEGELDW